MTEKRRSGDQPSNPCHSELARNLWNLSGMKFEIAAHDSGVSRTQLPRQLGQAIALTDDAATWLTQKSYVGGSDVRNQLAWRS
jgi:hypothetical protein